MSSGDTQKKEGREQEKEKNEKKERVCVDEGLTEENGRIVLSHSLNQRDALFEEFDAGHIAREQMRVVSQHIIFFESRRDVAHILGAGLDAGDVRVASVVGQLARVQRVHVETQQLQGEVRRLVADVANDRKQESDKQKKEKNG